MRYWLRKWLPDHDTLHRDKGMKWISTWLRHHPYLWHLNRTSVARGFAAGLLVAFIPLPLQMLLAALLAFLVRGNLPIAVVTTWISNPITFVPFNYLIYKTGKLITQNNGLNGMPHINEFTFKWESISLFWKESITWLSLLGPTYIIGLIVVSVSAAFLGYWLIQLSWNIYIRLKWRARKK